MRRSPLQRTTPLKARRPVRAAIDRQAREAWARGVRGKPCVRCGSRGRVQGHHILTQQSLRRRARELAIDPERVLWDTRNRLPVCERCHVAHHSHAKRIGRVLVDRHAGKVAQFARELGLEFLLDREYPPEHLQEAA